MSNVENIILESPDGGADKILPPDKDDRAVQLEIKWYDKKNKTTLYYRLCNNAFLEREQRKGSRSEKKQIKKIVLHAGFLSEKCSRSVVAKPLWLFCALMVSIGAFVIHQAGMEVYFSVSALFLAALCLLMFFKSLRVYSVFKTQIANAPIIEIAHKWLPSTERKTFIKHLKEAIVNNPLPMQINHLAEETKLLRTSQERGFISEKNYQRYRDFILKQYPKKS